MTAMTPPAAPIPGAGLPAATVYATWRRILREAPLAEAMFDPAIDDQTLGRRFGLDDDGVATVRAYAATPKPTRMFILNYRFRMTGSVQNALETAAPLTMRALKAKGLDLRELAEGFLEADHWQDDGPFVVGYCARILDHLAGDPATEAPAGLRDLIALDRATAGLLMRLADAPPQPAVPAGHVGLTGRAVAVTTAHDLAPWLRNSAALGREDLLARPAAYLVAMPDLAAASKVSALPPRGALMLAALEEGPLSPAALTRRLGGAGAQDAALLGKLAERGAVVGA
ncbi:hypothetical protein [uncultured Tistrella sp.]|uniref:hypothetical protein n=1 Tax=Tistrella mobilis TaxID=171437 RepID=UPI000C09AB05|nr:hypothetical protein [uncultured Tistrella sp.]MAM76493.1 hypothetical protein [Tistrella sp.]